MCSIQVDETVKGFRITYLTNNTAIWNEEDYSVKQNEYNGFNPWEGPGFMRGEKNI